LAISAKPAAAPTTSAAVSRRAGAPRASAIETYDLFELHVRNCVDVWDVSVVDGSELGAREAVWAAEASRSTPAHGPAGA
jgi:hypothetical protein